MYPRNTLDLQVLFERLEEQFDLPAIFVDRQDGGSAEAVVVAQEYQRFAGVFADGLDAAQQMRAFLLRARAGQADHLVLEDIPALRRLALFDHLVLRVVFHARDEEHAGRRPIGEQAVIVVAPVIHHDGARREGDLPCRFDVGDLAVGHQPETRYLWEPTNFRSSAHQ